MRHSQAWMIQKTGLVIDELAIGDGPNVAQCRTRVTGRIKTEETRHVSVSPGIEE